MRAVPCPVFELFRGRGTTNTVAKSKTFFLFKLLALTRSAGGGVTRLRSKAHLHRRYALKKESEMPTHRITRDLDDDV